MAIRVNPYGGEVEDIELYGNELLPPPSIALDTEPHIESLQPGGLQQPEMQTAPKSMWSNSSFWTSVVNNLRRILGLEPNGAYPGRAPLGRNIYGKVGYVNTHFPRTNPNIRNDEAHMWVDRDGYAPDIYLGDEQISTQRWGMNEDKWRELVNRANQGDFEYLGINSDEDLKRYLEKSGYFYILDLPKGMRPKS